MKEERKFVWNLQQQKNCLKYDRVKQLFPKNDQTLEINLRKQKKYKTNKIRTERYKKSAIPSCKIYWIRKSWKKENRWKKNKN